MNDASRGNTNPKSIMHVGTEKIRRKKPQSSGLAGARRQIPKVIGGT